MDLKLGEQYYLGTKVGHGSFSEIYQAYIFRPTKTCCKIRKIRWVVHYYNLH